MKKRFIIFYSIFAALFILSSLTYLGFNLFKEYKEGDSRSRSIFANTVFNLYSDLPKNYNSGREFYDNISKSAGSLQDYSFYEIEKNNNIIYSYPGQITQKDSSSKLTKSFSTRIEIEDDVYLISCNIYLLRPYSIFYYSRITFLLILGITLLTFILILFSNKRSKSEEVINDDIDKSNIEDVYNDILDCENNEQNTEELINGLDEEQKTNLENNLKEEYGESPFSNENVEENTKKTSNEPEGLFSSLTGFGWESYLETRLNNEINRAIASEMDISLFIIKLTNLDRSNPLTRKICDYIADQFQFRDLLFEYKNDCLVAIKTGDNLDEALNFAEKLHEEISSLLNDVDAKCYIGITTRSVRMISAERFIHEAEQALNHAVESDNDPIIAFKADVEKYRKYVEQKFED